MSFYWISPASYGFQNWLGLDMERVYLKRRHPKPIPGNRLDGDVTIRGGQAYSNGYWTPFIRVTRESRRSYGRG